MKSRIAVAHVLASSLMLSGCGEKGTGEKVGVVTKLARSGFFCKTWEGQIIRGGLNAGSGAMGAAFDFTVEDLSLLPKIKEAMEKQQEIKITYREELMTFCRSDSNDHFITSVTVMDNKPAAKPGTKATLANADTAALLKIIAEQNEKILALVGTK
jgi:hypothetical protein